MRLFFLQGAAVKERNKCRPQFGNHCIRNHVGGDDDEDEVYHTSTVKVD